MPRILTLFFLLFLTLTNLANPLFAAPQDYYRLDDFDASYDKLDDPPLPPVRDKDLPPSSIYKQNRPPREDKPIDTSRIPVPPNPQALNRLHDKPIYPRNYGRFFVGALGGFDIYADSAKRYLSLDLSARLGYWHHFEANALRTYLQFGVRAPLGSHSAALPFSLNGDFLLDLRLFHFYLGAGFGAEWLFKHRYLSYGAHINVGLNRSFGRHSVDAGLTIPFYRAYDAGNFLENAIIIALGYNFKF